MKKAEKIIYTLGLGETAKGVGNIGYFGVLNFTRAAKRAKLGTSIKSSECIGPTAEVLFYDIKAVDSLVSDLKRMRKKMKAFQVSVRKARKKIKPLEIVIDASNNNPIRRVDKQRQIPRKRKKR